MIHCSAGHIPSCEPLAAFADDLRSGLSRWTEAAGLRLTLDLEMGIMFVLFLSLFVLIGIYPAVLKTLNRIDAYLKERDTLQDLGQPDPQGLAWQQFEMPAETSPQLGEYEEIVLRSLAMSRYGWRSATMIADDLHIGPELVERALESLHDKGLVTPVRIYIAADLYLLTRSGRDYAAAHGLFPFPRRRFR